MNRRGFLKATLVGTAATLSGIALPAVSAKEKQYQHRTVAMPIEFTEEALQDILTQLEANRLSTRNRMQHDLAAKVF